VGKDVAHLKICRSFRALKVLKNVKARKTRMKLPLIPVDVERDVKKREISDLDSRNVDARKENLEFYRLRILKVL